MKTCKGKTVKDRFVSIIIIWCIGIFSFEHGFHLGSGYSSAALHDVKTLNLVQF